MPTYDYHQVCEPLYPFSSRDLAREAARLDPPVSASGWAKVATYRCPFSPQAAPHWHVGTVLKPKRGRRLRSKAAKRFR